MKFSKNPGVKTVQKVKSQGVFRKFLGALMRGLVSVGMFLVMALLDMAIAVFVGCILVPAAVVTVSTFLGVGFESAIGNVIFMLGFPSVFLMLLLVVFTLWLLRQVNAIVRGIFDRIAAIGSSKAPDDAG